MKSMAEEARRRTFQPNLRSSYSNIRATKGRRRTPRDQNDIANRVRNLHPWFSHSSFDELSTISKQAIADADRYSRLRYTGFFFVFFLDKSAFQEKLSLDFIPYSLFCYRYIILAFIFFVFFFGSLIDCIS